MKVSLFVVIMLAGASLMLAGDIPSVSSSLIVGLTNADATVRAKAESELKEKRKEMITKLMELAKGSEIPDDTSSTKELAVILLGEYRATEATNWLVDNIEYQVSSITWDMARAAGYPCVRSLASIGVPSLDAIVTRLEKQCSEKEMKLFATVFQLVDGDDIAPLRAELAMKKTAGQQQRNLEQLVELLKTKQWYF